MKTNRSQKMQNSSQKKSRLSLLLLRKWKIYLTIFKIGKS
jgi:hypothetical protein